MCHGEAETEKAPEGVLMPEARLQRTRGSMTPEDWKRWEFYRRYVVPALDDLRQRQNAFDRDLWSFLTGRDCGDEA